MSRPFVGAVASVAWEDFGGGGLRRWPFLVEGDLVLAGAACSGARRPRAATGNTVGNFGGFGCVALDYHVDG